MASLSTTAKAFKTLYLSNKIDDYAVLKAEREHYITSEEKDIILSSKTDSN